jgi:hypothetical protein
MAVSNVQEEERLGGGPWAHFASSLHFSWLGSGQGALGSTATSSRSMATGFGRARIVIFTVASIWLDFICQVFDELPARISNSKF